VAHTCIHGQDKTITENQQETFNVDVNGVCKTCIAASCQHCLQHFVKTKLSCPLRQRSLASWFERCILNIITGPTTLSATLSFHCTFCSDVNFKSSFCEVYCDNKFVGKMR